MAEYIERDKVLEEINERISNIAFTSPYLQDIETVVDGMERARDSAEDAPAADVAPVVHGRWETHPQHYGFDRCSVCHDCIIANDWADGLKWNYCPNCGAKMDGEVKT